MSDLHDFPPLAQLTHFVDGLKATARCLLEYVPAEDRGWEGKILEEICRAVDERLAELRPKKARPAYALTPAQYARFGGQFCPVCLHQTLEYGDTDEAAKEQQVWCTTCRSEWRDRYELSFVDLVVKPLPPRGETSRIEAKIVVADREGNESSFPTSFLVLHEYGNLNEDAILRYARDIVGFVRIQEHTLTEVLS